MNASTLSISQQAVQSLPLSLRSQRLALRWSQGELGRQSGVKRVRICLHELGELKLTDDEQARIKAAFRREAERLRAINTDIDFTQSGTEVA
jgi:hypothetical protein